MLRDQFAARYSESAVRHSQGKVEDYQKREWEIFNHEGREVC